MRALLFSDTSSLFLYVYATGSCVTRTRAIGICTLFRYTRHFNTLRAHIRGCLYFVGVKHFSTGFTVAHAKTVPSSVVCFMISHSLFTGAHGGKTVSSLPLSPKFSVFERSRVTFRPPIRAAIADLRVSPEAPESNPNRSSRSCRVPNPVHGPCPEARARAPRHQTTNSVRDTLRAGRERALLC